MPRTKWTLAVGLLVVTSVGCPDGGGGETTSAEGGEGSEVGGDGDGDGDGDGESGEGGGVGCGGQCVAVKEDCFDGFDGECACVPGAVLCGPNCVDIKTDPANCGACGNTCDPGQCENGRCTSEPPPVPGFTIAEASGSALSECGIANEAKPERSVNGPVGEASNFVAFQRRFLATERTSDYNWTPDGTNAWTPSLHTVGPGPGAEFDLLQGDPWSATHGGTGLEYLSFIGRISGTEWCVAVAAGDRTALTNGAWVDGGAFCAGPLPIAERHDGPMVFTDLGGPSFYTVYASADSNQATLRRFSDCTDGVPGGPDCPFNWQSPPAATLDHANGLVNPCTHHPILLTRSGGEINARFFALNGDLAASAVLAEFAFTQPNTRCGCSGQDICKCGAGTTDCGGQPDDCHDIAHRVHAAVQEAQGVCTLHVAYDESYAGADGNTYMRAVLKSFDVSIGKESAPVELQERKSAIEMVDNHNDFEAVVVADYFTPAVGLFHYRQVDGAACDTRFGGLVSADGSNFNAVELTGPFPTLIEGVTSGLGHYIAGARFSRSGHLLVSWSQPIPLAGPELCLACQGTDYRLAVLAADVVPD